MACREIPELNLKRFFVYSIAVHALLIASILFLLPPPEKKKEGGEFLADLVSPEELSPRKPQFIPPRPRVSPPTRPGASVPASPARRERKARGGKQTAQEGPGGVSGETEHRFVPPSTLSPGGLPGGLPRSGGARSSPSPAPTLKELFDEKVVGDLAMRNLKKEEKKENTFTFDAEEYRFLIYNRRLKERIESIWRYPPEAAAQGIYGDLVIKFTIKKNGLLGAVELVRTSGHKDLDDAAMEALREGAPYWPLPDEWHMDGYTIEGHFIYTLYGFYIR